MDEAYRTKLSHWLTSMLVLHLFTVIWTAYSWFGHYLPLLAYNEDDPFTAANFLFGQVENYALLFIPLFLWHLFDFWQGPRLSSPLFRSLTSYRWLLLCLCAFGLTWLLVLSPWLNDLACPPVDPGHFGFGGCGTVTPDWKVLLSRLPMLGIVLLLVAKAMLTVVERAKSRAEVAEADADV